MESGSSGFEIIESASGLGKKWLFVVPFYQSLRLTDFEVSAGLFFEYFVAADPLWRNGVGFVRI
jgi:hypothetical protein